LVKNQYLSKSVSLKNQLDIVIDAYWLNKSVGEEEAEYYKPFCLFKNHIRISRYALDA